MDELRQQLREDLRRERPSDRERADLEAAIARVRELHQDLSLYTAPHEYHYCSHCRGPGESGDAMPWPCPTIQALDGN